VQTDDLIANLSSDARPAGWKSARMRLLWPLAIGAIASFAAMDLWLGIRPDLSHAMTTSAYWMKFAYTLGLAVVALLIVMRLARPGADAARRMKLLIIPVGTIAALTAFALARVPDGSREHLLFGASSAVCPWRIVALSLPLLAAAMAGMRRLAPTQLGLAGVAAGLLAGAAGAWIYAFHCDESAAPFVAVWYTFGIGAVAVLGGLLGKWLLRW